MKETPRDKDRLMTLADELSQLERAARKGDQGISYVQAMIFALRRGDLKKTQEIALSEGDKILDLPEIKRFVVDSIFEGSVDENMIPKDFGKNFK